MVLQSSTSLTGSENHQSPLRFQTFTEKYFEIGMKLNDFSIQLVKYCTISKGCKELEIRTSGEIGTPVPEGKIRAPGGGRKKSLDKDPILISRS